MQEIMPNMEPSAHQKHQYITGDVVKKIAADNEHHGEFYVFREKNMVEFAVGISRIHIQEGVEPYDFPEKDIH